MITVYTRPGCLACVATKAYLNRHGIGFEEVDITRDSMARDHVLALGYRELPVVVSGGMHFCGLRPDRLLALKDPRK